MQALKLLNNRYQLITVIKRGGFGTIYKGYDSVLAKDIAVKEINRDLLQDAWYIEQFQKEARHVAKMNHQNIVHIFDLVRTDSGQFYIVMEYIDGLDLSTLLKQSKAKERALPQHLAVHIVAEICKALDYAHNCSNTENHEPLNLVHQDVSPSNIMISKSGGVKLIDFGIAGAQKAAIEEKDSLMLQGKVQYMSPEHVNAALTMDRRSDIFSLGLVLYELLEGRRFFSHREQHMIIETLRNGRLKLKHSARVPKPLQQVMSKALEKSPQKRYQNANQFYIDLVTYLVLNSDAAAIDAELGTFVRVCTEPVGPLSPPVKKFGLAHSDELSDVVLDDVGKKSPAPQGVQNNSTSQTEVANGEHTSRSKHEVKTENLASLPQPTTATSLVKPPDYFEVGDEIKTVIDVVRLSTRENRSGLKRTLWITGAVVALFLLLDVFFQWTGLGAGVYDFILPPAIKVVSVPNGARVYLNDKLIKGVTPLTIDKIEPGVYELKLKLEPYRPIVKSLFVPGKGQAEVKGEQMRNGNAPYTFRFKTTLEIASEPSGAQVYINNVKYGQTTPCSVTWEVGERCELELAKAGFSELTGFALDTEEMLEEIDDRRLWSFEKVTNPTLHYKVRGRFGKYVVIHSTPENAAIYLDNNPNPVGTTGKSRVFLTAARHKIVLEKKGYNPRTLTVMVNNKTPEKMFASLTRKVRFVAYDATDGKSKDLKAAVTRLVRGKKTVLAGRRTPFVVNLAPQEYYATFSKAGYKDVRIKVSARDRIVTARMEPANGRYSVVILDKETHAPLSNVEVRLKSLDNPAATPERFDITDQEGTVNGSLAPGLYLFRTSKNGYEYREQSVVISAAALNLIEFNLPKK